MNRKELNEYILRAISCYDSDDLERAQFAFHGLSPEVMAQQYGQSGKSRQAILDGYAAQRELNRAARKHFLSLIGGAA